MQKQLMEWDARKTRALVYVLIAAYLILFLPLWEPVILGFLFAAACAPVMNLIKNRLHATRTKVAYGVVAFGLIFVIGIVALVAVQGFTQIYDAFKDPSSVGGVNEKITGARDTFLSWAQRQEYLQSFNIKAQLDRAVVAVTNTAKGLLVTGAQLFVSRAPIILLNLFVFIAAFGAFLVVQPRLWGGICQALRLGDRGREHFRRFEKICGLAIGSVLITGFAQSVLVVIGAAIAGVESLPMVFGVTFIFALIPVLGAGLVPALLTIYGFVSGDMRMAITMLVTAIIVGVADNIIRAWLFSRAAKSNPVISLISLIGGITLFGFPGLFIAPVLEQLVMTYAFSDEGEPRPSQVTAAAKPARVDTSDEKDRPRRRDEDLVPRPT